MIRPKTTGEIKIMREGGSRHAQILLRLKDLCVPGASSLDLERSCRQLCQELDVVPAFLNYRPAGSTAPYPAALCFSINDEIVHGIPNKVPKLLKSGDVVTLDLGIIYQGLITDAAITVGVGEVSAEVRQLINVAEDALHQGIQQATVGAPVSAIGAAIETAVKNGGQYAIYRGLVGHGVGYEVHEDPNVPNFNTREQFPVLPAGAVIAIEPMIGLGTAKFQLDQDDWTYRTADGSVSVHVEHTVAVTAAGPLILTAL